MTEGVSGQRTINCHILYCTNEGAYSGEIQVTIKQGEEIYSAEVAEVKFEYQR
ncbi:hypothetical protein NXW94_30510 [Bacteroides ovatus]|nr:hypothetical protein [Bacteroides ovatus]